MAVSKVVFIIAAIGIILAIFWPTIEKELFGNECPWPINLLHSRKPTIDSDRTNVTEYLYLTEEQLRKYDASDESLPILMSVDGKIIDVTAGSKFYAKNKAYHQFAGRACTRALALTSLELEDIHDDVSDFNEKQKKELDERIKFYHEKYPIVGELVKT